MESMMRFSCILLFSSFVIFQIGCGGSPNPDSMFAERFDSKIKKLAVLYTTYQTRNNWTGPADEKVFREYIDSVPETRLDRLGITKSQVDELFVSVRDGKPYRIRWEMVGGNGVPPKPILFESEGERGKFMVGFTNGTCQEFTKEDYDKLWDGQGDDGSMTGFNSNASRQ